MENLREKWVGGFEAWINISNTSNSKVLIRSCLFVQPSEKTNFGIKIPALLENNSLFSITAYDPLGNAKSLKENIEATQLLKSDIDRLNFPNTNVFFTVGFNLDGHREDGFGVVFERNDIEKGRDSIINLAKKYNQGAIYESWDCSDGDIAEVKRRTLPALMESVDAITHLTICTNQSHTIFENIRLDYDVT
eukprot:GHVL01024282.1.p1 GENE.GHVL01024282.1~~GHVL01024282.1.p1  ORF type:complete len:192 (+),score=30.48 GHVL01024282.1:69-644(+)